MFYDLWEFREEAFESLCEINFSYMKGDHFRLKLIFKQEFIDKVLNLAMNIAGIFLVYHLNTNQANELRQELCIF